MVVQDTVVMEVTVYQGMEELEATAVMVQALD